MGLIDEIRPLQPGFTRMLADLTTLQPDQRVPSHVITGLSLLVPTQVVAVQSIWHSIPLDVRRDVMAALIDAAERDFELDFSELAWITVTDTDAQIRQSSLDLMADLLTMDYLRLLHDLAQTDPALNVRVAAVRALGPFVLAAEVGQIPEDYVEGVADYLLAIVNDETLDGELRGRALESASFTTSDAVTTAIEYAYDEGDARMHASAIFAMGASNDERWAEIVLGELKSRKTEYRYEAARAAGELMLVEAIPQLTRLTAEEDQQVAGAAIWALGEIATAEAIRVLENVLERAEEEEDDALADLVEEALENASASSGDVPGLESPDLE